MTALARLNRLLPDRPALAKLAPGVGLCAGVALLAVGAEPLLRWLLKNGLGVGFSLPAIVIALGIGMTLHRYALLAPMRPGVGWCAKPVLRIAVGLLGLRIALGDIAGLGFATAVLVMVAMAATTATAMMLARWLGCSDGYGALSGAANAVCGASATLATATVLPAYKNKDADIVFTVVMANAISTIVMVAYPPLCILFGFSPRQTGIMLGATVHDMAQVVGAGYGVSDTTGDVAVIVKMFRVLLLLPVVVTIGWWFHRKETRDRHNGHSAETAAVAAPPVPGFTVAFLVLCVINSILLSIPALNPVYLPIKHLLSQISSWGLLIAIAALGLGTSLDQLLRVDWRQLTVFLAATLLILTIGTAGIALLG